MFFFLLESASFVRHGIPIMSAKSLFTFTVRALVQHVVWCLSQLPRSWNVNVDVDQLMRAVTMDDGSGQSQVENVGMSCPEQSIALFLTKTLDPDLCAKSIRSEDVY